MNSNNVFSNQDAFAFILQMPICSLDNQGGGKYPVVTGQKTS